MKVDHIPCRSIHALRDAEIDMARDRLDTLARLLDSAVRVPGTNVRVGADALLNLVPGVGTLASKGLSSYLIWEARRLGVPTGLLLRMVGNVGVDLVLSAIPVVGWLGDVFYRSNERNMALLRAHLATTAPPRRAYPEGARRPGGDSSPALTMEVVR